MKKFFLFAIAISILFSPVIANAQMKPGDQSKSGFIIFLKESPVPEDPSEWFVIFPTTISAQAIEADGYHPFEWTNTEDEAFLKVAQLIATRFPDVTPKDWLKFVNFQTNETVFVRQFSAPKPFGFAYEGPPLSLAEVRALQGKPFEIQVGPFKVKLTKPPKISGPVARVNPPPPPPPRPPVRTTPPQTPPVPQPQPENPQPGDVDQPVQVDSTQGVHVDPRIVGPEPQPIPEDDTEGTYAEGNDEPPVPQPIPNEGNTTSDQPSANQNEPTPSQQTPTENQYADMAGQWLMERWTEYANFTVSQNGNKFQLTHDYPWSGGMRHSEAVGTIEDQPCKGARIGRVDMDFTYTEPDGRVSHASYTGDLTCDENGKAVRVSWSNGSNWKRP